MQHCTILTNAELVQKGGLWGIKHGLITFYRPMDSFHLWDFWQILNITCINNCCGGKVKAQGSNKSLWFPPTPNEGIRKIWNIKFIFWQKEIIYAFFTLSITTEIRMACVSMINSHVIDMTINHTNWKIFLHSFLGQDVENKLKRIKKPFLRIQYLETCCEWALEKEKHIFRSEESR